MLDLVKFIITMMILIFLFQILVIFDDLKKKEEFNRCRDNNGSIIYCITGAKI